MRVLVCISGGYGAPDRDVDQVALLGAKETRYDIQSCRAQGAIIVSGSEAWFFSLVINVAVRLAQQ